MDMVRHLRRLFERAAILQIDEISDLGRSPSVEWVNPKYIREAPVYR